MLVTYGEGWGSHLPTLATAIAIAPPGPVLELGAGEWSTPMLHRVCAATGRKLLTVESNPEWIERFLPLRSDSHRIVLAPSLDEVSEIDEERWALVFVDHAPGARRVIDIVRLAWRAHRLVVHDTQDEGYNYEPIFATFKHRYDDKDCMPWTSVLSNFAPYPAV